MLKGVANRGYERADNQPLLGKEYTITRLQLDNKLNIDMYFTDLPNPVMELFLTGNKYFNIFMRKRANSLGFKLTNS